MIQSIRTTKGTNVKTSGLFSIRELRGRSLALLKDVTLALDEAGVQYWLDYGSLLGAVREGRSICWDGDYDLSAVDEDIAGNSEIWTKLQNKGYAVFVMPYHIRVEPNNGKIGNMALDLHRLRRDDNGNLVYYYGTKYTKFGQFVERVRSAVSTAIPRRKVHKPILPTYGVVCQSFLSAGIKGNELETLDSFEIELGAQNSAFDFKLIHASASVSNNLLRRDSVKFYVLMKILSLFPTGLLNRMEAHLERVLEKHRRGPLMTVTTPGSFCQTLGEVEFHGMRFKTPMPVEGYLERIYGPNWRTPVQKWEMAENSPLANDN